MAVWKKALIGAAALIVVVMGGTLVYAKVSTDNQPERLTLSTTTPGKGTGATGDDPTATTGTGSSTAGEPTLDGTWSVKPGSGSVAGYRVKEVLNGIDAEAVGRTDAVTGSITISGTTVTKADFTVDMASVTSDQDRRDGQFRGRIMDTASNPTSSFELTKPIPLDGAPGLGKSFSTTATGRLTLKGTTRSVTLDLTAQRTATGMEIVADHDVKFADFGIDPPDFGFVKTEDHGLIEVKLVLTGP
ncbi:MAG: YceI family protein [Microthrixaceae bacterium]